ncbi:MAG: glycosyltransferase family A protein [Phycisphaerales bacterium]|jgi:hypothetical protein
MSSARVSIILPFRDAQRTLGAAIASILWQTFDDFTLVLLDDGSSDDSLAVARAFADPRVVVLTDGSHRGLPSRLNQGIAWAIAEATHPSPLIARMDADDIAHPRRLERQVAMLDADPRIDLCGTGSVVVDGLDRIVGCRRPPADHETICRTPYRRFPLAHPTWLGRAAWFARWRYDELATRSQDYQLLHEAYATSVFANVPDLLLAYSESERRLGKAIGARLSCAQSLWRRGVPRGELTQAIAGSVGLLAGSLADVAIGVTGRADLGGIRLRPTSAREGEEWRELLVRVRHAVPHPSEVEVADHSDGSGTARNAAPDELAAPAAATLATP